MKRSKFLKKSLAALLSLMLIVAMIPVGAAAAGASTVKGATVTVNDKQYEAAFDDGVTVTADVPTNTTGVVVGLLMDGETTSVTWTDKSVASTAQVTATKNTAGVYEINVNGAQLAALTSGSTITIEATAVKNGVQTKITITLNKTISESTDVTINDFSVWAKIGSGSEAAWVQYNATHEHVTSEDITIHVPYDTTEVYAKYLDMNNSEAQVTVTGTVANGGLAVTNEKLTPNQEYPNNLVNNETAVQIADFTKVTTDDTQQVATVTMTVTSGGSTRNYTVKLVKTSGFVDNEITFAEDYVIDSLVLPGKKVAGTPEDGTIFVLVDYGTATKGGDVTLTPEAKNLDFDSASLSCDATWKADGKIDASKIIINDGVVHAVGKDSKDTHTRDDSSVAHKLRDWADYLEESTPGATLASKTKNDANVTDKSVGKITVSYVEGDSVTYDVYVIEPVLNNKAVITSLYAENEKADIDEAAKTITVTLPSGSYKSETTITELVASGEATVSAPLETQPAVRFATKNGVRDVTEDYAKKADPFTVINALNKTPIIRVVSEDGLTTNDYKLIVNVSSNYEWPKFTGMTLSDGTNNYEGKILKGNVMQFTLPYTAKLTRKAPVDLAGWTLSYAKTTGSVVETAGFGKSGMKLLGNEAWLDGTFNDKKPDTDPIVIKSKNPATENYDEDKWYIQIDYAAPSTDFGLTSVSGTGTIAPKLTHEGKNVGTNKWEIPLAWSHFHMAATGSAEYGYLKSILVSAVASGTNAKVYYNTGSALADLSAATAPVTGITFDENDTAIKLYVVNEQTWVDILDSKQPSQTSFTLEDLKAHAGGYAEVTVTITCNIARTDANLASLTLVDGNGWAVNAPLQKIAGTNVITGEIPYAFTTNGNKIRIKYDDSNRAWVLGVDESASTKPATGTDHIPGFGPGQKLRFWGNGGDLTTTDPYLTFTLPTEEGGYATAIVCSNGKAVADCLTNVLWVSSEAGTTYNKYTLQLTVADAHDGTDFASFKLVDPKGKEYAGQINQHEITVNVPFGTEITALKPVYEFAADSKYSSVKISTGADMHPDKSYLNFSTTRVFTVTAENGKHTTQYSVKVHVLPVLPDVVEGTWYYKNVHEAFEAGIINGKDNGLFAPDATTTRAEFAVMVANLLGADVSVPVNSGFPDVDEMTWGKSEIAYGHEMGYLSGDQNGNFKPNATVTRQEAASILARALNLVGKTTGKYKDDASIASWASKAVYACKEYGVFVGKGDGSFAPTATLTRAEAATALVGALHFLNK